LSLVIFMLNSSYFFTLNFKKFLIIILFLIFLPWLIIHHGKYVTSGLDAYSLTVSLRMYCFCCNCCAHFAPEDRRTFVCCLSARQSVCLTGVDSTRRPCEPAYICLLYVCPSVRLSVRLAVYLHCVSKKKQDTKLLPITSPNVNRFSKFFSLVDSLVNLQLTHI